jgi:hypothetical protein
MSNYAITSLIMCVWFYFIDLALYISIMIITLLVKIYLFGSISSYLSFLWQVCLYDSMDQVTTRVVHYGNTNADFGLFAELGV